MTRPKTRSATGFWSVDLNRRIDVAGFAYLPGLSHTVDDATLKAMREQDAETIANAVEAP